MSTQSKVHQKMLPCAIIKSSCGIIKALHNKDEVRSEENLLVPSGYYVIGWLNQSKAFLQFIHKFALGRSGKKLLRGLKGFSFDINRKVSPTGFKMLNRFLHDLHNLEKESLKFSRENLIKDKSVDKNLQRIGNRILGVLLSTKFRHLR